MPYSNEATRSSIINGIKNLESQTAWTQFFDRYAGFIFALARQRGLRPDEADEVVQSVMIGVTQAIPNFTYDRNHGSFRSWLGKRVHWRIVDQLRKRPNHLQLDAVAKSNLIDTQCSENETLANIEWNALVISTALERLRNQVSSEHFSIFHASVIEDWDTDKVLRTYGISKDNLYQIRKRVRVILDDLVKGVSTELDSPVIL